MEEKPTKTIEAMLMQPPKKKKCRNCQREFTPSYSSLQRNCSLTCEIEFTNKNKKKTKVKVSKFQDKLFAMVRDRFLQENPVCQKCTKNPSTEVHHKKGRIGDLLTDKRYFLAVCTPCHKYIELNPKISKENGWSLSRLEIWSS